MKNRLVESKERAKEIKPRNKSYRQRSTKLIGESE